MRKLMILLLVLLMAFGCLAGETDSFGVEEVSRSPAIAPVPEAYYDESYVAKESWITVKVAEGTLQSKFDEMQDALDIRGAELSDVSYNEYSTRKQYTATVKVSPDDFDGVNELLKEIGEVKDMSVTLEDVTQQYVDLDTRITNREVELERIYDLYNKSRDIEDLLAVERELTRVETELEILKQQKQYLVNRVEKSTITITLYEDKPSSQQLVISLEGLSSAFFGALGAAITLIVVSAGFLLPIGIVVGILWYGYKKLTGKKARPRKSSLSRIPPPQ